MTTTLTAPTIRDAAPARRAGAASLPRTTTFLSLLHVELRKLINTRAGRWLLIVALLTSAAATAVAVWVFPTDTLAEIFLFAFMPLGLLLPVCAILSATGEWSQRTGLTTFALEPRRWRVAAAKLAASQLAAVAAMVVATAIAYAGVAAASLGGRTWGSWALDLSTVGGAALNLSLLMLQASALGFLLLNAPAAIVLFFVVPQLWTTVVNLVPALGERAHWLDLTQALQPIFDGVATAGQWANLLPAAAIWVLLPLAAGIVRFLRAEVK